MGGRQSFSQGLWDGHLWRWLAAGLSAAAVFGASEEVQSRTAQAHLNKQAHAISAHLAVVLARPLESLHALRALFQTPGFRITKQDFLRFSEESLKRHPEVTAFEWAPFVDEAHRSHFEAWVRTGEPQYRIWSQEGASPLVATHIPITFSAPDNSAALGLDLATLPSSGPLAKESLTSGRVTVSDRYQLIEYPSGVLSVVSYAPVRNSTWATPPGSDKPLYPEGVVILIFGLESLMEGALAHLELKGLSLKLEDKTARPEHRDLYSSGVHVGTERSVARVPFADRVYELTVAPAARRSPLSSLGAALAAFLLGAAWIRLIDLRARTTQLRQTLESLGQYRLERKIATGGMGTVYRAHHALLRRPAAIKIAHKDQSSAHFEREARLHSTLNHPNTVTVFDFGRGEDGTFYAAMEYVEGYDLYRLVTLWGPVPAGRAARILIQAAASLQEAHKKGLIHRDVKPSNIMITERGGINDFVKVLDFGLARSSVSDGGSLSSVSASTLFVGTPGYIAPEVIAGAAASPASDVFSLGCVAYFLVVGRGPFEDPSPVNVLSRVVTGNSHAIPESIPRPFAEFIERCLERRPENRPVSMGAVIQELGVAVRGLPSWTPEDAERFWREHPPVSLHPEDQRNFSIAVQASQFRTRGGASQDREES